jgi:hypothetical protein
MHDFDEWWESISEPERKMIGRTNAKYVWVCATQSRKERDAKIAESWNNGSAGSAAKVIARCIRAQGD